MSILSPTYHKIETIVITFLTAYCFLSWYNVNTNPLPPLPILALTAFPLGTGYCVLPLNLLSRYKHSKGLDTVTITHGHSLLCKEHDLD